MLASPLTPGIQIEPLVDGARYRLAPRDVGPLRFLGLVPLGIGLGVLIALATAALLAWRSYAATQLPAESPDGGSWSSSLPWPVLLFGAIFALIFLKVAFSAIRFGLLVLGGHGEIVLQPGRLTVVERAGPFSRRERVPLGAIEALRVEALFEGGPAFRARVAARGPGNALARLVALPGGGQKVRTLAIGYPAWELETLAADLAQRLPAATLDPAGAVAGPPRVERVADSPRLAPGATPWDSDAEPAPAGADEAAAELDRTRAARPPDGSPIVVSRAGGLEVEVPPAGLLRGSHGIALLGLLWLLLTGGMLAAVVFASDGEAIPILMLLLFVAVGGLILYLGARMGLRRTRLSLAPPLLVVERTTLGRSRIDEIRLGDLRAVSIGPSGFEVNGRAVPELKLRLAAGREIGLLLERRPEELEWLASLLRDELRSRGHTAAAGGSSDS